MKDGKRRQAEYAQRLREAGLREVSVWMTEDEYELVKELGRGRKRRWAETARAPRGLRVLAPASSRGRRSSPAMTKAEG
jgi:hypothetical protein